ncbi:MAG: hypothetical protein B7Y07_02650 [Halothiobacillus sp. 24-54-40]|nr:MAG: hypothetical protein B7Y58_01995 [Halothiobacillus sp. 35-54-62]OYZ87824.1 MAG: hypothetical protein B7Y07_02650 [Halothiobacillus sp. 24-54-40]OZA81240.1 MAG: hypothetical protein B7X64_02235 [Halothiobacillus sp. 39-53-45]HQS02042.1 RhuM family protein [Halothiobacillus sp.]HQS28620.1 RhuM family protein [Halothiobacillus sp.]
MNSDNPRIQIFTRADGQAQLSVAMDQDTAWLSLEQMVPIFERYKSVIFRHLRTLFAADGKTYQVDYYNLDVIISVGYRVKSARGKGFKQAMAA